MRRFLLITIIIFTYCFSLNGSEYDSQRGKGMDILSEIAGKYGKSPQEWQKQKEQLEKNRQYKVVAIVVISSLAFLVFLFLLIRLINKKKKQIKEIVGSVKTSLKPKITSQELLNYHELYEKDIISEEEFKAKKDEFNNPK